MMGLCLLLLGAADVTVLRDNGPSTNRIDVVVFGDGYRAQDRAQFDTDAAKLVTTLFQFEPYKSYAGAFNVKTAFLPSNEDGADKGTLGTLRDTAFGANYFCDGVTERLLCVDDAVVLGAAAAAVPEFDIAIVVVNDPKYGGSGGPVPVVSVNTMSSEVLIHELGHSLGGLGDEYAFPGTYPLCAAPDCAEPNVTMQTARAQIKWRTWIPETTAVPTTVGTVGVGLFEGARYRNTGIYRPVDTACVMNLLGQPFCPVCAEALALSIFNRVKPIDAALPQGPVALGFCQPVTLSVTHPQLAGCAFVWSIDGVARAPSGPTFTADTQTVPEGTHEVAVTVDCGTPKVRNDPNGLQRMRAQWTVTASYGGQTCMPTGACGEAVCQNGQCVRMPKAEGAECAARCAEGRATASHCLAGICTEAAPASCGAYACDVAGARCLAACQTVADCASGLQCVAGACVFTADPVSDTLGPTAQLRSCSASGGMPFLLAVALWLAATARGSSALRRAATARGTESRRAAPSAR